MTAPKQAATNKATFFDWSLQDILRVALSYRRFIVLIAIVFIAGGFVYDLKAVPLYQATTTVRLPQSGSGGGPSQMIPDSVGADP
ncbi:MAG TPA: Wzz/FepE/Etk N-terminal domain-containing protein, partial [bacterium]|nr:Wzz/FepE/Etk N-terminal domain-containing protein [bacterium]